MNRRDYLLQEMGITQWQLRRPDVLKGAINIAVEEHIRLLVIAECTLSARDFFIQDVLRSAEIKLQDCLFLTFSQAAHLTVQHPVNYWLLSDEQGIIEQTLTFCTLQNSLWQTPDLPRLKLDRRAKQALWKQIQTSL
ncbi:DNA polymerase III subunit psi [Basfia succiniciproducens]|uniref:DNA polymerase III subunit psi n=1 Tax=Basfia succiniciproducens TaxID=653940 RepID=UPI0008C34DC0|nr:DNA polymerase III subunit psi [Basfia succiniciproducens]SEQ71991.1 DNA polymerase III, psi subunit [Basfia succiniciproducens]